MITSVSGVNLESVLTSALYDVKYSLLPLSLFVTVNVEQSNTFNEPSLNLAATSFNFASVPAAAALPKVVKATDPSYKVEPNLPDQSVSIDFD